MISLDQVSYRAPGGKEFKPKDVTGSWSTNFISKISFVQRILIWRNFRWKSQIVPFFSPEGPPAFDVILFWCLSFISLIQPMIKSILILPHVREWVGFISVFPLCYRLLLERFPASICDRFFRCPLMNIITYCKQRNHTQLEIKTFSCLMFWISPPMQYLSMYTSRFEVVGNNTQ